MKFIYLSHGHTLDVVDSTTYLGMTLADTLDQTNHVNWQVKSLVDVVFCTASIYPL